MEEIVGYLMGLIHLSPIWLSVISTACFLASEVIGAVPSINGNGVASLIKNVLIAAAKGMKTPALPPNAPKV